GVLLPFSPGEAVRAVARVIDGRAGCREVTMAEVRLNDGQRLVAFNDFYLGQRTHVSSRYSLTWRGTTERQSSSGVLVSTGAGSTGWLSSTQNMARAVCSLLGETPQLQPLRLEWGDERLVFVVREPFLSRASDVRLTAGLLDAGAELRFESHMPD